MLKKLDFASDARERSWQRSVLIIEMIVKFAKMIQLRPSMKEFVFDIVNF